MKIKKIILSCVLALCSVMALTACGNNATLTNGSYQIQVYSIDGTSQTQVIGQYATVNDGTFVDWVGNVASYTAKNGNITITFTYDNVESHATIITGKYTKNTINIDCYVDGSRYIITMKYVEDVVMTVGKYKVVAYTVNGNPLQEMIGKQLEIVDDSTILDWDGYVAKYTIVGNRITITWVDQHHTLAGTVTATTMNLTTTADEYQDTYTMVMQYQEA